MSEESERNKVLVDALERLYEPLCDITFCVQNPTGDIGQEMIREAVQEIQKVAKTNQWFIDKLKEED